MNQIGAVTVPEQAEGLATESGSSSDALPADALDINVEGREPAGPEQGFGRMWQKRYRIRLTGAAESPAEVIQIWKDRFGEFWPGGNRFYRPFSGLQPGEVALVDLEMPAGTRLSTGIIVVHVDQTSFTLMTPQGHTFSGKIGFSAFEDGSITVAQVEIVMRASDPLFEVGMYLGGHEREDRFWKDTLTALATHFGVTGVPEMETTCIDRNRQWRKATNVVHNSYIRTGVHMATKPLRSLFGRSNAKGKQP